MKWKFWEKEEKHEHKNTLKTVPFASLYRWYCYDIGVTDLDRLDTRVGLIPISEDAKQMELAASDERMFEISHLMPFLEGMAEISSMVFVETQFKTLAEKSDLNEEELMIMMEMIGVFQKTMALAAIVGSFSAAASLGIIEVPYSSIKDEIEVESI